MGKKQETEKWEISQESDVTIQTRGHFFVKVNKHWAIVSSNKAQALGIRPQNLICLDIGHGPCSEMHPRTHQAHGTKMIDPTKC